MTGGERVGGARRVLFASVAEPKDPWASETVRLFSSLREFGGRLSDARACVYFVAGIHREAAAVLRDLDVEVRSVPPVGGRFPHANKLVMLDHVADADWLVALDTDTAITGDLSDLLLEDAIRARVVDGDPLAMRQWRALFAFFGIERTRRRLRTTATGRRTIEYFNSGALFIPCQAVAGLGSVWRHYVNELPRAYEALPELAPHAFYTDQFALALSLAATRSNLVPLGVEVNTPTHVRIHPRWKPHKVEPKLLHYHHRVDSNGGIELSDYRSINLAIMAINNRCTRL